MPETNYLPVRLLAEGGFGVVHLVRRQEDSKVGQTNFFSLSISLYLLRECLKRSRASLSDLLLSDSCLPSKSHGRTMAIVKRTSSLPRRGCLQRLHTWPEHRVGSTLHGVLPARWLAHLQWFDRSSHEVSDSHALALSFYICSISAICLQLFDRSCAPKIVLAIEEESAKKLRLN